MARYRRRELTEAIRYDGSNASHCAALFDASFVASGDELTIYWKGFSGRFTLKVGDYVLNEDGISHTMNGDLFEATYEPVEE